MASTVAHASTSRRVACLLVVALLAGCGRTYYTPDAAGVVDRRADLPDGSSEITLADGTTVAVDPREQLIVLGSGLPDRGELLLTGTAPRPWVARLTGADPCFWVGGSGSEVGAYVETDAGLRLPKAADFDRRHYHETEHRFTGAGFCVDAQGRVSAVR